MSSRATPRQTNSSLLTYALTPVAYSTVIVTGAIFGFFYAWVCSTMWGLDTLDPNAAIDAMNAMNISVRNAVFMPAFFGTPILLIITAALAWIAQARAAAYLFAGAAALYLLGAFAPTANINVPMNEALKLVQTPLPSSEAQQVWSSYSADWQVANVARTVVSAVCLLLALIGLRLLPRNGA